MSSTNLTLSQKENILNSIQKEGSTAVYLSKITGFPKNVINNLLFTLECTRVHKITYDGVTLPIWKLIPKVENKEDINSKEEKDINSKKGESPYIIIDLGNVHDCLQSLNLYKGAVVAFCNKAYNGYGVTEICTNKQIKVYKINSLDKNAVISEIFFHVNNCILQELNADIIIVTKSNLFSYLPEIAKQLG
jgi:hypothetical protein